MKRLEVEWRHYAKDGGTCVRCGDTGQSLAEVVQLLKDELSPGGISVQYIETLLPEEEMRQSNIILFNGTPLEDLLQAATSESSCRSCSCLTEKETFCRTVEYSGTSYESIPADLIRAAAARAVERMTAE